MINNLVQRSGRFSILIRVFVLYAMKWMSEIVVHHIQQGYCE